MNDIAMNIHYNCNKHSDVRWCCRDDCCLYCQQVRLILAKADVLLLTTTTTTRMMMMMMMMVTGTVLTAPTTRRHQSHPVTSSWRCLRGRSRSCWWGMIGLVVGPPLQPPGAEPLVAPQPAGAEPLVAPSFPHVRVNFAHELSRYLQKSVGLLHLQVGMHPSSFCLSCLLSLTTAVLALFNCWHSASPWISCSPQTRTYSLTHTALCPFCGFLARRFYWFKKLFWLLLLLFKR